MLTRIFTLWLILFLRVAEQPISGENNIEDYPYVVFVMDRWHNHLCVGSMVSKRFALTLAESIRDYENDTSALKVKIGGSEPHGEKVKIIEVKQLFTNSNSTRKSDVLALMFLMEAIRADRVSGIVHFVTLPTKSVRIPETDAKMTVVGWQHISYPGGDKNFFRSLEVVVAPWRSCASFHRKINQALKVDHFCTTGETSENQKYCLTYLGAPLLNDDQELIGVLRYVSPEKNAGCRNWYHWPVIYVSVSPYREWMAETGLLVGDDVLYEMTHIEEDMSLMFNIFIVSFSMLLIVILVCCNLKSTEN